MNTAYRDKSRKEGESCTMINRNKLLSLLTTLVLALSLLLCGAAAGEAAEIPAGNGDIVILFTSDVHCGIDQNFGFAGLLQVKNYLISEGNAVILADDGDQIQGEPIGTLTRGEALIDLMNTVGYDVAIPGNHEFDYGMDRFFELVKKANHQYISCNFTHNGELVFEPYTIRELAGKKVAFIGVTTPKTISDSTPSTFQDENGNFVYSFMQDETGEQVYQAIQKAADAARVEGADYVILMGHMGNEAECRPWTYADVISHTKGIDAFLDGHSHDTDQVTMKNAEGKNVLRIGCGTKLKHIGWCRIAADGTITAGLYNWDNPVSAPAMFAIDNEASRAVKAEVAKMEEKLKVVVAHSTVELMADDPVQPDFNGQSLRIIRVTETNMGDLSADAFRAQGNADIAVLNAAAIRANIKPGDITVAAIRKTYPYLSYMSVIEATGQQILDALELGAMLLPLENGSFLQVSGLTLEIHSYIPSSVVLDENDMFVRVDGERRVKNVKVGGEPIDPEKNYSVSGRGFILQEAGGGFSMFKGCKVLQNEVKADIDVLVDYINETLGGTVGAEYEDPYGQGRINILEKPE